MKKTKKKTINPTARYFYRQFVMLYQHSWRLRARIAYQIFTSRTLRLLYARSAFTRRAIWTIWAMIAIVGLQFAYPRDRVLPFSRLESVGFVGYSNQSQIFNKLLGMEDRQVLVHSDGNNVMTSYGEMGIRVSSDATFDQLSNYSIHERLIPFSIIYKSIKQTTVSREVDVPVFTVFASSAITSKDKPARDAVVRMEGAKLEVTPAIEGYEYQLSSLRSQLLHTPLDQQLVGFKPTSVQPRIYTDSARMAVQRMQQRIDRPLLIRAEERSMTIDSPTLASWVDITARPEQGAIDLTFNKTRIANTIRGFAIASDIPSTPTKVTLLNGSQAGTNAGQTGRAVDFDGLVSRISEATSAATTAVEAQFKYLSPEQVFERHYTRDSLGIQSLIDYWAQSHKGNYGVVFKTLNGRIEANHSGYRQFASGGLEQLFIASTVEGRVNSGTTSAASVDSCLNRMMRSADTSCMNSLGALIGWGSRDDELRNQGFYNTSLSSRQTTASDSADWMIDLAKWQLTTSSQADALIDMMSGQIYRSGIPSGSRGIQVANKTSIFGGNRHDVGIVYHPRGTYVLAVLSDNGSSFAGIAELTQQINDIMNE